MKMLSITGKIDNYEDLLTSDNKEFRFYIFEKNIILFVDKISDNLFKTNVLDNNFTNLVDLNCLVNYLYENSVLVLEVK